MLGLRRAPILAALLLFALSSAVDAQAPSADLTAQRKLLAEDLASYQRARADEDEARTALGDLLGRLDQALAEKPPSLGQVAPIQASIESATNTARGAAERSDRLRERIVERLRTIDALTHRSDEPPAPAASAVLTGRWRVTVRPGGEAGTFDLVQVGALLSGTYQLSGGAGGSLRGTVAGDQVHLDRIDRGNGFDRLFEGRIEAAGTRIVGTWTPTVLSGGGPGGGDWTATREAEGER